MLSVDIHHRQGDFTLACTFASSERVIGVFGPSGAGKSTLLRAIAGLSTPESGRIEIAGHCVFDGARGIDLPAHRRRIGYVFQQARLFPHLNVRHNLGYGSWFAVRKPDTRRFKQVVEMLDIGTLLGRRINGLSGGEQQRVAIGRALLSDPALLLLDEPLASLDARRKREVLPYIERLSRESELPIVFVSHQLDELLHLANRYVVAIRSGQVAFAGATENFLARPELLGEGQARDAGALLHAQVAGHSVEDGLTTLDCEDQSLFIPWLEQPLGTRVTLHVRARDVMLAARPPVDISALNVLEAEVVCLQEDPSHAIDVRLRLRRQTLDARITRRSARLLGLAPGQRVYAVIKSLALAEQAWERIGGL